MYISIQPLELNAKPTQHVSDIEVTATLKSGHRARYIYIFFNIPPPRSTNLSNRRIDTVTAERVKLQFSQIKSVAATTPYKIGTFAFISDVLSARAIRVT